MSYTVAICVPPVPDADKTAWAGLPEIIASKGSIAPALQQLYQRLTAGYPCICSLPDESVEDGVWSDGPLINNFGSKAAVLGVVFSRVDEVLPFLVETANQLGLVVFDEQINKIHREFGASTGTKKAKPWWKLW